MWTCRKCKSNLLDTTVACPVCQMPDGGQQMLHEPPPSAEKMEENYSIIRFILGLLIPPMGLILAFFNAVSDQPTKDEPKPPGKSS